MNKKYELEDVCSCFLTDSYMLVNTSKFPKIKFEFDISGGVDEKYWKVNFLCNRLIKMSHDSRDLLDILNVHETVLEVSVKKLTSEDILSTMHENSCNRILLKDEKYGYQIVIEGGIHYDVYCVDFSWELIEISKDEFDNLYFNEHLKQ